jgi:hypothetical protein
MTLDEVLRAFERLLEEQDEALRDPGPGSENFQCVDCVGCHRCRFCTSCLRCEDCTYCEHAEDCVGCTQSRRIRGCVECTHCMDCTDCQDSQYLTLCVDCRGCVQCFACVGLANEEFCVLNERYPRTEYFELVGRLREALHTRLVRGDLPSVTGFDFAVEHSALAQSASERPRGEPEPAAATPARPSLTRGARPPRRPTRPAQDEVRAGAGSQTADPDDT